MDHGNGSPGDDRRPAPSPGDGPSMLTWALNTARGVVGFAANMVSPKRPGSDKRRAEVSPSSLHTIERLAPREAAGAGASNAHLAPVKEEESEGSVGPNTNQQVEPPMGEDDAPPAASPGLPPDMADILAAEAQRAFNSPLEQLPFLGAQAFLGSQVRMLTQSPTTSYSTGRGGMVPPCRLISPEIPPPPPPPPFPEEVAAFHAIPMDATPPRPVPHQYANAAAPNPAAPPAAGVPDPAVPNNNAAPGDDAEGFRTVALQTQWYSLMTYMAHMVAVHAANAYKQIVLQLAFPRDSAFHLLNGAQRASEGVWVPPLLTRTTPRGLSPVVLVNPADPASLQGETRPLLFALFKMAHDHPNSMSGLANLYKTGQIPHTDPAFQVFESMVWDMPGPVRR